MVNRADGMAERVDRAEPLLEGGRTHGRSAHHLAARLQIGAVGISAGQVVLDQPHAFQRDALAHRVVMRAGVRLDAMGKGIQPGAGGNELRHADGQFGVHDDLSGEHPRVKDDLLLVAFGVGYDARAAHFRPCPGGCRNSDNRRNGLGIRPCPPVADILEIPERAGLSRHEGHGFREVQTRTAAKGNHPVKAARVIDRDTGFHVCIVGVGVDIGKESGPKPRLLHQRECPARDLVPGQSLVRDQERFRNASGLACRANLRDAASAETNGVGVAPIGGQAHGVTFLR